MVRTHELEGGRGRRLTYESDTTVFAARECACSERERKFSSRVRVRVSTASARASERERTSEKRKKNQSRTEPRPRRCTSANPVRCARDKRPEAAAAAEATSAAAAVVVSATMTRGDAGDDDDERSRASPMANYFTGRPPRVPAAAAPRDEVHLPPPRAGIVAPRERVS